MRLWDILFSYINYSDFVNWLYITEFIYNMHEVNLVVRDILLYNHIIYSKLAS
jgi:hypothetical protein